MAKYGYIKIDEKDPDVGRQAALLDSIGGFDKIFAEQNGLKKQIRKPKEQLTRALDILTEGDVLFVAALDRVCSGPQEFISLVEGILDKNAHFVCLETAFDTRNAAGKTTLKTVKKLNEINKQAMSDKKKEGIRVAKQQGKRIGRPPVGIPVGFRKICEEWSEGKITGVEAIKRSGLKSTTFYAKAEEFGYKRKLKK